MAKRKPVRAVKKNEPMSRSGGILLWLALTGPAIIFFAWDGNLIVSLGMIAISVWFGLQADGTGNGEGAQHWDQGV